MRFKTRCYHNPNDFKFGTWKHEHHNDGSMTVRGILKKTGNLAKYIEIFRCD